MVHTDTWVAILDGKRAHVGVVFKIRPVEWSGEHAGRCAVERVVRHYSVCARVYRAAFRRPIPLCMGLLAGRSVRTSRPTKGTLRSDKVVGVGRSCPGHAWSVAVGFPGASPLPYHGFRSGAHGDYHRLTRHGLRAGAHGHSYRKSERAALESIGAPYGDMRYRGLVCIRGGDAAGIRRYLALERRRTSAGDVFRCRLGIAGIHTLVR